MRLRERLPPVPWNAVTILLLVLVGIAPAILMWHWLSTNWVPVPFWDQWHSPGSQFESWCRGTLTLTEMFSQHNETRNFFPRLLYFALERFGGWDVRKEMRVILILVCTFCLLLLHLLRRTPGATPVSTMIGWATMTFLCFAPVQIENFLYGIELENFFPGVAVLAAAAVNLSRLSFRAKTLINLSLAFVATYTFANGMLLWVLAWPLPAPNETTPRRRRFIWTALYLTAGAISVGCYFVGYHRPSYHPALISVTARFVDLVHYLVLWVGTYFSSDLARPFLLGIVALSLFLGAVVYTGFSIYRRRDWRTFYPWLLAGAYACASGTVTAIGRLGFGLEQATATRYAAFTLYFYVAIIGLYFAIYCAHVRPASAATRTLFLTNAAWLSGLTILCWELSLEKNLALLPVYHEARVRCLRALEWMGPIPDNPDLTHIFPYVDVLKERARVLEENRILRLPFIHDPLASEVLKSPPAADGVHGRLETSEFDSKGILQVKGWAWLPERNRQADCVVIGCEDPAGVFKPLSVLETGVARPDLRAQMHNPRFYRAGFWHAINPANILPGPVVIKGWAIDLQAQKAWPLALPAP
jgi:hypothetical protein